MITKEMPRMGMMLKMVCHYGQHGQMLILRSAHLLGRQKLRSGSHQLRRRQVRGR
jgi:hypothetical protein